MIDADLILEEADAMPTGVMVALYPSRAFAKGQALKGGEDPDALHVTLTFHGKTD